MTPIRKLLSIAGPPLLVFIIGCMVIMSGVTGVTGVTTFLWYGLSNTFLAYVVVALLAILVTIPCVAPWDFETERRVIAASPKDRVRLNYIRVNEPSYLPAVVDGKEKEYYHVDNQVKVFDETGQLDVKIQFGGVVTITNGNGRIYNYKDVHVQWELIELETTLYNWAKVKVGTTVDHVIRIDVTLPGRYELPLDDGWK